MTVTLSLNSFFHIIWWLLLPINYKTLLCNVESSSSVVVLHDNGKQKSKRCVIELITVLFITHIRRHSIQCSSVLNAAKMCRCGWLELLLLHQLHLQSAYTVLFYTHFQTFIDLPDWFSWQHEATKPDIFFSLFVFLKRKRYIPNSDSIYQCKTCSLT